MAPKRRTAILFEPSIAPDPAWPVVIDADEEFYFKPGSGLLLGLPADETPVPPCDVQPEELDVAIAIDRIERAASFRVTQVRRKWAGLRTFARQDARGRDGPRRRAASSSWPARAATASRSRPLWRAPRPSCWWTACCRPICSSAAWLPRISCGCACGSASSWLACELPHWADVGRRGIISAREMMEAWP